MEIIKAVDITSIKKSEIEERIVGGFLELPFENCDIVVTKDKVIIYETVVKDKAHVRTKNFKELNIDG